MIHIFLMICHRKFHVFHKAFLVGHVINQGRKSYSGRHACLTKEKFTEMLRASRRHRQVPGGVRTATAMHCGFKIFKMAATVEKLRRLYALFFNRYSSFLR